MSSTTAPDANATTDARSRHFVFVDAVGYWHTDPDLDVIHAELFECHSLKRRQPPPVFGQGPHETVRVIKNVYNLTPVFPLDAGLVVNQPLRDQLASCCTLEFADVVIERAFWLPFAPGDDTVARVDRFPDESMEDLIARCANAHACSPPRERFYMVVEHSSYRRRRDYKDARTVTLAWDAPDESSVFPRDVIVSQQMIEEHGLVYGGGYLLRPDIFELLNPYLHRPYYWAQRYLY